MNKIISTINNQLNQENATFLQKQTHSLNFTSVCCNEKLELLNQINKRTYQNYCRMQQKKQPQKKKVETNINKIHSIGINS